MEALGSQVVICTHQNAISELYESLDLKITKYVSIFKYIGENEVNDFKNIKWIVKTMYVDKKLNLKDFVSYSKCKCLSI